MREEAPEGVLPPTVPRVAAAAAVGGAAVAAGGICGEAETGEPVMGGTILAGASEGHTDSGWGKRARGMEAEVEESRWLATGGPGAVVAEAEDDKVTGLAAGAAAVTQEANTAVREVTTRAAEAGMMITGATTETQAGSNKTKRRHQLHKAARLRIKSIGGNL